MISILRAVTVAGIFALCVLQLGASPKTTRACATVELRLAEKTSSQDLIEITVPLSGEKLYMRKDAVLTGADIIEVHADNFYRIKGIDEEGAMEERLLRMLSVPIPAKSFRSTVSVQLTKDAGERLGNVSKEHRLKPIVILVDGVVVFTAASLIPADSFQNLNLSYDGMTKESAEHLSQELNRGCLTGKPECVPLFTDSNPGPNNVRLEFRIAERSQAEGLVETKVECTDQKIYLHKEILITNEDIADAKVISSRLAGEYEIAITFTKEGADRLSKETAKSIGKMMVIMINGTVITNPTLQSPISANARITGNFSSMKEWADRFVAALKKK